jgi:hypothetical protein
VPWVEEGTGVCWRFFIGGSPDATGRSTSLLLVPPHSPLPSPCTPCWRSHPCWPQALHARCGVPAVAHFLCTSHFLRRAEGVVPSTPTRGPLPWSGRGTGAGTNVREALEPSPVSFGSWCSFSSGEAPMPRGGLPRCYSFPLTLPCLPPAFPAGRRPPLLAEGHPCPERPPNVAQPPCTPHPPRRAEGVVPSTPTRGQLPWSGRGTGAGTNVREALEPSPVSFEFSGDDSSGKPRCHGEVYLFATRFSLLAPAFPLHSMLAQPSLLAGGHPCPVRRFCRSALPLPIAPSPPR